MRAIYVNENEFLIPLFLFLFFSEFLFHISKHIAIWGDPFVVDLFSESRLFHLLMIRDFDKVIIEDLERV